MKGTSLHIASPITQMSCNIIGHEQNNLACEIFGAKNFMKVI